MTETLIIEYLHQFENIVFEGGGVHGLGYIGCIAELERRGMRATIRQFGGASIGTLIAVMMACNISADNMLLDLKSFSSDTVTGGVNCFRRIYNLLKKNQWGLYDISVKGRPWIESLMLQYLGNKSATLTDLYNIFGNDVILAAYNRTRSRPELISRLTMPTTPIADILLATLSFPGMFTCQPINGELYIDGGITNNCPIYIFDRENRYNPKTLAIRSVSDASVFFAANVGYTPQPPTNLEEHLVGIVSAMVESGQQRYERPDDAKRTYFMKVPHEINSLDFDISDDDKNRLYDIGLVGLAKFLDVYIPE